MQFSYSRGTDSLPHKCFSSSDSCHQFRWNQDSSLNQSHEKTIVQKVHYAYAYFSELLKIRRHGRLVWVSCGELTISISVQIFHMRRKPSLQSFYANRNWNSPFAPLETLCFLNCQNTAKCFVLSVSASFIVSALKAHDCDVKKKIYDRTGAALKWLKSKKKKDRTHHERKGVVSLLSFVVCLFFALFNHAKHMPTRPSVKLLRRFCYWSNNIWREFVNTRIPLSDNALCTPRIISILNMKIKPRYIKPHF